MSSERRMRKECKQPIKISSRKAWKAALATPRPVLVHLNADTTWLIQLPYPRRAERPPPAGRSRFNLLLDPWLQGPQSDVASWFSTQWHVTEPSVATIAELNDAFRELEGEDAAAVEDEGQGDAEGAPPCFIDAVVVSHEFTDHCHRATLEELPRATPVFATDEAARLIGSWGHFDTVITTPPFSNTSPTWKEALLACHPVLPPWLGVGRVVTPGNSLYYHSAIMIVFDAFDPETPSNKEAEAILYSPHGIEAGDLGFLPSVGLKTLALLHGMHDVRIWMTKQLNLGAHNGLRAVRASGARYWVATHDEVKVGAGLINWLLRRTAYILKDAVETEEARLRDTNGEEAVGDYQFIELASGDALMLV
ncbi:hypothetical protein RB600_007001 [Gaeumannomyces tritici]